MMRGKTFWKYSSFSFLCVVCYLCAVTSPVFASTQAAPSQRLQQVEQFIQEQMATSSIPGLSVTIVEQGKTIYQRGFGYADVERKRPVTDRTLFELGSDSKAFTGLALLKLQMQGRLQLSDPVTKYLPWLQLRYKGQIATITLEQLLHHTSGIPTQTIDTLPEGTGADALEQTVRTLLGQELDRKPGESYEYATINYDVLGLVIEKVTGQSFESLVSSQIVEPSGLTSTYVGLQSVPPSSPVAVGYKMGFTRPWPYVPPPYRGNTPAAYVVTDAQDMAKWLNLQLGLSTSALDPALIQASHQPDRTVPPDGTGFSYAAGWDVYQRGRGEISHLGANPTFSAYLGLRPGEKLGVAVLANMNSDYTANIGQGIVNILVGKDVPALASDLYKKTDQIAFFLLCVLVVTSLTMLFFIGSALIEVFKRQRRLVALRGRHILSLFLHLLLAAIFAAAIYYAPQVLLLQTTWGFLQVWGPFTLLPAAWLLVAAGALYFAYSLMITFFPKKDERAFLSMVILSLVSGIGNAFIIFVINETFIRTGNLTNGLLFYFAIGLLMYIVSQKFIRTRLVKLTNEMVYAKRMEVLRKLLHTSFGHMETIERGRIEATLSNDTETISRSINIAVTGVTSLLTLICCFIYLGAINFYAFLLSLVVIVGLAALYYTVGQRANAVWEQTRDIQNVFYGFIIDLTRGFKELALHRGKLQAFQEGMGESCGEYRDKRTIGDLTFANVLVLGELLFTIVIGCVAFVFPEIFKQMTSDMLRNYVFVLLYMTGPVNALLDGIPQILVVRVSWRRINEMIREIEALELPAPQDMMMEEEKAQGLQLELHGVTYTYRGGDDQHFSIGPIDCAFRSGEIVFITGGNGSGKSTLAKLLTGLYTPDQGSITVNGEVIAAPDLGQLYSAVFADFHLFDRLYGIDFIRREEEICHYLTLLELQDKISVTNGRFSTTQLSTGQKKRLALLVVYLEDRPICLFDEWAADQDPEYRHFFYHILLPEMKSKGKCVIAISHDDRYFHLADQMIRLDMGQVVTQEGALRGQ